MPKFPALTETPIKVRPARNPALNPYRQRADPFAGAPKQATPEGRLAMALFKNACECLLRKGVPRMAALWWCLHDPRPSRLAGFVWVCDVLGFSLEDVRQRIIRWARAQKIDWSNESRCVEAAGLERFEVWSSKVDHECVEPECLRAPTKHRGLCREHAIAAGLIAVDMTCSEPGCRAIRRRWASRCDPHYQAHREAVRAARRRAAA